MDRKALAVPDSITFVFVFLGIMLLFIIFLFAFRALDSSMKASIESDSMNSIAALALQDYMMQPVQVDLNQDGIKEESRVAELISIAGKSKEAEDFLKSFTESFFDQRLGIYWKLETDDSGKTMSYGHGYGEKLSAQLGIASIFSPYYAPAALEVLSEREIEHSSGYLPTPEGNIVRYDFTYWVLFHE